MDIKPVEAYEPPKYGSFELKTGAKLAVGAACLALVAGMASGCQLVETVAGGVNPKPTEAIYQLDGDVVAIPDVACTPAPEMLMGAVAQPYVIEDIMGEETSMDVMSPAPGQSGG